LSRIRDLSAVVGVGPNGTVMLGGGVDNNAPAAIVPPMQAADCDPWLAALVAHYAAVPIAIVAPAPDTVGFPRLGLLDFDALIASARDSVGGVGTPAPAEALGVCLVDEPWGWGDPERPWRPCGQHLPLRASAEDLRVRGGVGQGVLLVDGDLTFESGVRYFGLVLVRGTLILEGGATFEGLALAAGGLRVASGAAVRGSACWAVRALAAQHDVLQRLVPVPGTGRLGPS
jgi:hypothetical protein